MNHRPASSLLLCALLFSVVPLAAGRAPAGSPRKSAEAAKGNSSARKIDVCSLLTRAEIEAVQGEPVEETKPGEQLGGELVMSPCFFRTPTFAKSVSLALATPDPTKPSALTPREFWRKQFHPPEQEEEEKPAAGEATKKPEPEREKELRKPRVIDGLGEEAYWVGSPITGALYVLRGDAFLRISVGGSESDSARLERTRKLARKALRRL